MTHGDVRTVALALGAADSPRNRVSHIGSSVSQLWRNARAGRAHSAAQKTLLVEPIVFHAPSVEDPVDQQGLPFDIGPPAAPALVDLGVAVAVPVEVRAAAVKQFERRVGAGSAGLQVGRDGVVLSQDLRVILGGLDRLELAVDADAIPPDLGRLPSPARLL